LSSNSCFTGSKASFYLKTLYDLLLTNISITMIYWRNCDEVSNQVRKTNVVAMNVWTFLLFGWLFSWPVCWWNVWKYAL